MQNCVTTVTKFKSLAQLVAIILLLCTWLAVTVRAQCFANQRLPKTIQSEGSESASHAEAIAAHEGLNAIFVGGHISSTTFTPSWTSQNLWAHVGRIDLDTRMWTWSKQLTETSEALLTTVTALAVDPAGVQVAVHGFYPTLLDNTKTTGYVFVLRTDTGASASGLLKMQHDGPYIVYSAGMVMDGRGKVFMAFNHMGTSRPNGYEQNLRVAKYDIASNTLNYFVQTELDYYGRSSALVLGTGAHANR